MVHFFLNYENNALFYLITCLLLCPMRNRPFICIEIAYTRYAKQYSKFSLNLCDVYVCMNM